MNLVQVKLVEDNTISGIAQIGGSEDAAGFVSELLKDYDREAFVVLNLNVRGKVINANIVSLGTLTETIANPREIFKASLLSNAAMVILVHNHPSGECLPSEADIYTTKRMIEAGKVLGITVADNIIIGKDNYLSFSMHGWIAELSTESGVQNVKSEVDYLRDSSLTTKETPRNVLYTGKGNFHIMAESGDKFLLKSNDSIMVIEGFNPLQGIWKYEERYEDNVEGLAKASAKFLSMTEPEKFTNLTKENFKHLSYEDQFIVVCEQEDERFERLTEGEKIDVYNQFMNDPTVTGLMDMKKVWETYDITSAAHDMEDEEDRLAERAIDLQEALFGADGAMMFGSEEDKNSLMKEYEALTTTKDEDEGFEL